MKGPRKAFLPALLLFLTVPPAPARAEGLVIQSRVGPGEWSTARAIAPLRGQKVVLRVSPLPGASVRWYRIRPDLAPLYKNANHPWEKDPYRWVGWARIRYQREEFPALRGSWTVEPFDARGRILPSVGGPEGAREGDGVRWARDDVGTFWIQAQAEYGGKVVPSPGLEEVGARGISPRVFRVSVREGEGYLGWLTSYFNVPGLFGSVREQTANYVGVDCADVLVSARDLWSGSITPGEASVASLVGSLPRVTEFELEKGRPSRPLRWGKDLAAGDILAVRYPGQRAYQHVGALYGDDGDGVLGGGDQVLHAGPSPLHLSLLEEGAFDGHCQVLRNPAPQTMGRR